MATNALITSSPKLPPAPWTYQQINGAYVVTDVLEQEVQAIPFDGDQSRATAVADFVCDAREFA